MNTKLTIGQILIAEPQYNALRTHKGKTYRVKIATIGKKYFTVTGENGENLYLFGRNGRFDINTLLQDNKDYSPDWLLHIPEVLEEQVTREAVLRELTDKLAKMSTDRLVGLNKIIID